MSPEEADRLGLKPFGDGGAENETTPSLGEFPKKRRPSKGQKADFERNWK